MFSEMAAGKVGDDSSWTARCMMQDCIHQTTPTNHLVLYLDCLHKCCQRCAPQDKDACPICKATPVDSIVLDSKMVAEQVKRHLEKFGPKMLAAAISSDQLRLEMNKVKEQLKKWEDEGKKHVVLMKCCYAAKPEEAIKKLEEEKKKLEEKIKQNEEKIKQNEEKIKQYEEKNQAVRRRRKTRRRTLERPKKRDISNFNIENSQMNSCL